MSITLNAGGVFERGTDVLPTVNASAFAVSPSTINNIYKQYAEGTFSLGHLSLIPDQQANINLDAFLSRHGAILGQTGGGKSWTVASFLQKIATFPQSTIVLFDLHGEYASAFADNVDVISGDDIELPYWLMNSEELLGLMVDRSESAAPNQIAKFKELLQAAKDDHPENKALDKGYLHKYSIADSIEDGTTLPLYYNLAPNEMLVPHETLDKEFLSLAEAEGVADIDELNRILDRAVNLKNFLKGKERIEQVARYVAAHYRDNVEPLGYKAFLVGVDREACESDDPNLIAMAERARAIQESFESRQTSTAEALAALLKEVEKNESRKKAQAEKGFDGLTFFVYRTLLDAGIPNADDVSRKIKQAFVEFPNWQRSESALRELRKKVTFAIFAETEELEQVTTLVDALFTLLDKAKRI